jgi:hypothetical protein
MAAAMIMALVHPVSAALFEQDFSSSTNTTDYIELTTPTANQLTLVNGGAISIDAGRLKIVNAEGTAGNVRRWVAMEGTPVGGMSFSFEMEITVAAGYAANTRLSTGTIGQVSPQNFMAWGIDATGVENEWNVTGTTAVKFTGPQTVTIFLNDSSVPLHYTDPAAGTQYLAPESYDVWVGTTLVSDGKTDSFVHSEYDLMMFNIGLTTGTAATWHFDNFEVLELPVDDVLAIYADDFSGDEGVASNSVPEVSQAGFSAASAYTGLNGGGLLQASTVNAAANYRFMIDTDPLTDDDSITEIRYTVEMRTPTTQWLMVGFHGNDAPTGFLVEGYNAGPIVQFGPTYVILRGGTWGGGNATGALSGYYSAGELITAEMTYHVAAQTMDLVINGVTVTNGWAVDHVFPVGTPSDPVVQWAQIQLRSQPTAAAGGAYIDSFRIDAFTDSGFATWATGWGVDIGASTNDYDGDGLNNLYEYGLGGNPTNALDRGTSPVSGIENVGGINYFGFVHPQLADPDSGLSYSLEVTTDLVTGTWTNAGYQVYGTNVTGGDLDFVTNVTDTVDSQKFIRLIIE